jgi:hypothetical protein
MLTEAEKQRELLRRRTRKRAEANAKRRKPMQPNRSNERAEANVEVPEQTSSINWARVVIHERAQRAVKSFYPPVAGEDRSDGGLAVGRREALA